MLKLRGGRPVCIACISCRAVYSDCATPVVVAATNGSRDGYLKSPQADLQIVEALERVVCSRQQSMRSVNAFLT